MKIHGHSGKSWQSKTYSGWAAAKSRCVNPKNPRYPHYGGRGIRMDQRWLESFPAFLADMGVAPEGATLDRIDNDGNYEPGNCRWTDYATQNRNNRRNLRIFFDGEWMTSVDVAARIGCSDETVRMHFHRGDFERWANSEKVQRHRSLGLKKLALWPR